MEKQHTLLSFTKEKRYMLSPDTSYIDTVAACKCLEEEFNCISSASLNAKGVIFVWTHASFVKQVEYYPFVYLNKSTVRMVYSKSNKYVHPIYYV